MNMEFSSISEVPAKQEASDMPKRKDQLLEKAKQMGKVALLAAFTSFLSTEADAQAKKLEVKQLHLPKMEMTPQQIKASFSEKPQAFMIKDSLAQYKYTWRPGKDFDTLSIIGAESLNPEKTFEQEEVIFDNKTQGFTIFSGLPESRDEAAYVDGSSYEEIQSYEKSIKGLTGMLPNSHSEKYVMEIMDYQRFDGKNTLRNHWSAIEGTDVARDQLESATAVLEDVIKAIKVRDHAKSFIDLTGK